MAIYLHTKYSAEIERAFTQPSFVRGNVSQKEKFSGVRTVRIPSLVTVPLTDYNRSGASNRYGTPSDVQDSVQELTLSQEKSWTKIIDEGDNSDQQYIKSVGTFIKQQTEERVVPTIDKYSLEKFVMNAGKIAAVSAKPDKTTILGHIADAEQHFNDNNIPDSNRFLYLTGEMHKFVKTASDWIGVDDLGKEALTRGKTGSIFGFTVIRVPSSYLPDDCYFLATYKDSVLSPRKIDKVVVHKDAPGYGGWLIEARYYYDAFVIGAKAVGVYACVLGGSSTTQQVAPTIAAGTDTNAGKHVITSASADTIKYTLDGTDPRYSTSALTYSAAFTSPAAGVTIKAIAYQDGMFPSNVTSLTIDE